MTVRAAIGLGSNLGDRARHIVEAVAELSALGSLVAFSALYETAPVGGPPQGKFLNAVAVIETELSADETLQECLRIEQEHGRERTEAWGPRTLDLDLLLYGDSVIDRPGLKVPHPRLGERRFVLDPLVEAWPDAALPDGTPIATLLAGVADQKVQRVQGPIVSRRFATAAVAVTIVGALAIWWLSDWVVGRF